MMEGLRKTAERPLYERVDRPTSRSLHRVPQLADGQMKTIDKLGLLTATRNSETNDGDFVTQVDELLVGGMKGQVECKEQVVSYEDIGQNELTMLYLVLVMETRGSSVHHQAQRKSKSKAQKKHMKVLRLNYGKLHKEEKARLWHWRLGHLGYRVPVDMTKKKLATGIDVFHCLNEDCTICEKAKFVRAAFPRVPRHLRARFPPFWRIYIDGFGGQKKFGVRTVHGATGGYVFVDEESGAIDRKLDSSKKQYHLLLEQYAIAVHAMGFKTGSVIVDDAPELYGAEAQAVARRWSFVIVPISTNTPQQQKAEKGIKDFMAITRAMMLGTKEPLNSWGAATGYATKVHFVVPNAGNSHSYSPFQMIWLRAPDVAMMFYRVFGASCEYKPHVSRLMATEERTVSGKFYGIEPPSALVKRDDNNKIMRVAFQKVVVFESKYCLDPNLNPVAVAEWELGQCKVAEKMPTAMPHIRSLRVGEEIGPEVESGGEVDEEFYEDNLEIDNGTIMKKIEEFREHLEQMKAGPERMEKLSRKLDELEKDCRKDMEVQPDILPHQDEVLERPNKIDETNIVSTSRSRKQTVPDHTWNQKWGSALMKQRVLRVFAVIEAGEEIHVRDLTAKMPKNFFEALMRDDWRQWIEAFRKEKQGFILNDVFEEVDGKEDPSDPIVPIVEVNTIKRDGTYKNRDAACGSKRFLAAGIDYNETFQPTGAAVTVRLFFSLMSTTIHIEGVVYKSGDVSQAYLRAEKKVRAYCYKPTFWDFCDWNDSKLARFRELLKVHADSDVLKKMSKPQRFGKILRAKKALYGFPDAGHEWWKEVDGLLQGDEDEGGFGMSRSRVDSTVYYKFIFSDEDVSEGESQFEGHDINDGTADSLLTMLTLELDQTLRKRRIKEWIITLLWVDDLPSQGTEELVDKFYAWLFAKHPGKMVDGRDFIAIEVKTDKERGIVYLTQKAYWMAAVHKFKKYFKKGEPIPREMPLPAGLLLPKLENQKELHEKAKHLPYPQLVGTLAFPVLYTKLDMKLVLQMLASHMSDWTEEHFDYALEWCLAYGYTTRDIGLVYSTGTDKHGDNVAHGWCDISFQAPKSVGARGLIMNSALIQMIVRKHLTIDISTTQAELTEMLYASDEIVGARELLAELGLSQVNATPLFGDCQPAISIGKTIGKEAKKTKQMDLRIRMLQERVDEGKVELFWEETRKQLMDMGTKCLPKRQHKYLRDMSNGYAALRQKYGKDLEYPSVLSTEEDVESEVLNTMMMCMKRST